VSTNPEGRSEDLKDLTGKEVRIIEGIQINVPLVINPFGAIGEGLSIPETEVIDTVARFRGLGIIRDISGIFNAESLGYRTNLAAIEVPDEFVEGAAAIINSHPGVSHLYLRDHRYNIWFTIALERGCDEEGAVSYIAAESRASDYLIMRNERLLKIGLMLHMGPGDAPSSGPLNAPPPAPPAVELLSEEREAVRLLQIDLPHVRRPFESIIESYGGRLTEERLLELANGFAARGILRRYAAVLHHRDAGYISNAMTVWKLPDGADIDAIAGIFAGRPSVSHLYLRSVHPGKWEYPLFAMIHAKSDAGLREIVSVLSLESGLDDYMVLTTLREFKKKRVTYLADNFCEWRKS
jgi:siroheme decarboxylase